MEPNLVAVEILDLDPLQGAEWRTCSATATCEADPSVSCTGTTTCASYNEGPLQWNGFVECDGVKTWCPVDESCVSACEAAQTACMNKCGPPMPGVPNECRYQCRFEYHACLSAC